MLGDEAINLICGLLPPDGAKSGEQGPAKGRGWCGLGEKLNAGGRGPGPELRALTVWVRMYFKYFQEGGGLGVEQDGESERAGRAGSLTALEFCGGGGVPPSH